MVVHVKVMAHEISPIVIICEVPHSMLGGEEEWGGWIPNTNMSVYCPQRKSRGNGEKSCSASRIFHFRNPHDINLGQELLITADERGADGRGDSTFYLALSVWSGRRHRCRVARRKNEKFMVGRD